MSFKACQTLSQAGLERPQPEASPIDLFTSPVDLLSSPLCLMLALSTLSRRRPFVSRPFSCRPFTTAPSDEYSYDKCHSYVLF